MSKHRKVESPFYMVYRDGDRAPAVKHTEEEGAIREARRIADGNTGKVYVLVAMHEFSSPHRMKFGDMRGCTALDLDAELFVVNPNGYIGESTRRAIAHAKNLGKPVEFMDPPVDEDWRNVG